MKLDDIQMPSLDPTPRPMMEDTASIVPDAVTQQEDVVVPPQPVNQEDENDENDDDNGNHNNSGGDSRSPLQNVEDDDFTATAHSKKQRRCSILEDWHQQLHQIWDQAESKTDKETSSVAKQRAFEETIQLLISRVDELIGDGLQAYQALERTVVEAKLLREQCTYKDKELDRLRVCEQKNRESIKVLEEVDC